VVTAVEDGVRLGTFGIQLQRFSALTFGADKIIAFEEFAGGPRIADVGCSQQERTSNRGSGLEKPAAGAGGLAVTATLFL
jgi:hypothetical protein